LPTLMSVPCFEEREALRLNLLVDIGWNRACYFKSTHDFTFFNARRQSR
jgi:hypothetical protein